MTMDEALQAAFEARAVALIEKDATRCRFSLKEARASFLSSLAASGYAVVPVEATEEMAAAAVGPSFTQRFAAKSIYAAMLAAAQKEQG